MAMLDEKHTKPADFEQPLTDSNSYIWGRIGEHNLVIASLPAGSYGTTSAATTALPMLASFPQIRFSLMVGIGAGIPSERHDIRLGDVAVSQPSGAYGGVVQYDLAKAMPGKKRKQKGYLNGPPDCVFKALANLQAQHELEDSQITHFLQEALKRNPKMAKSKPGYIHQGFDHDRLFQTSFNHIGGESCQQCDSSNEIQRMRRESIEPEIHYGNIASGNTLIKDAIARDELIAELEDDLICFEMEAAGLMNSFPCLVVRGISDYADSHKNDRWQRYAAATAAAYAKEFLAYVSTTEINKSQKALDTLENGQYRTL